MATSQKLSVQNGGHSGLSRKGRMWCLGLDEDDDESSDEEIPAPTDSHSQNKSQCSAVDVDKFASLKRRREEIARSSSGKRIKSIQREALKTISDEIEDGADRETIEESGVRLLYMPHQQLRAGNIKAGTSPGPPIDNGRKLRELASHMGKTEHLLGLSMVDLGGGGDGSSELEKKLDKSLQEGDMATAAKISDEIADTQLAIRIANAAKHRDAEKASAKELQRKERKRKRLRWGFDSKQRWERKGNM